MAYLLKLCNDCNLPLFCRITATYIIGTIEVINKLKSHSKHLDDMDQCKLDKFRGSAPHGAGRLGHHSVGHVHCCFSSGGNMLRGTRRTTWLAQCTEPYIDVMDEKLITLTSPCERERRGRPLVRPRLPMAITWSDATRSLGPGSGPCDRVTSCVKCAVR